MTPLVGLPAALLARDRDVAVLAEAAITAARRCTVDGHILALACNALPNGRAKTALSSLLSSRWGFA
jgi:hypothetical protein